MEAKPLLICGDLTAADPQSVFTRLPRAGLAVNIIVASAAEARTLWERMSW